jgi:hypothetical protein
VNEFFREIKINFSKKFVLKTYSIQTLSWILWARKSRINLYKLSAICSFSFIVTFKMWKISNLWNCYIFLSNLKKLKLFFRKICLNSIINEKSMFQQSIIKKLIELKFESKTRWDYIFTKKILKKIKKTILIISKSIHFKQIN